MYDGAPAHFNINIKDVPDSYSCKPVGSSERHSFLEKCWNAGQALTKIWRMLGIFQHLWNSWFCRCYAFKVMESICSNIMYIFC